MTEHLPAIKDDTYGPAMLALRNGRMQLFVDALFTEVSAAAAARVAGYGENSSALVHATIANRLLHNPNVVEAIQERLKVKIRSEGATAYRALMEIVKDISHKDRLKAIKMVLQRIDPEVEKVDVQVTHQVDHDVEALNQLRALKALNVARDKLVEVFGDFGLERLEKQLAVTDQSKIVDATFEEVKPASNFSTEKW